MRKWTRANDLRLAPSQLHDEFGELQNRKLGRVPKIDRSDGALRRVHELEESINEIIAVAEGSRLRAFAVNRDRLAHQRLADEVAHHTAIEWMHTGAVRVEDAHDTDVETVLTVVIKEQCFRCTLALVVTRTRTDGIHISSVTLGLRMHIGVAVHLTCRRMEDLRAHALCETKHVDRAEHAGFHRLDWVVLVVARSCRAREIVNLIDLKHDRLGHIMPNELEVLRTQKMRDIRLLAREKIVEANHIMAHRYKAITQMGTKKSGAASHKNSLDHRGRVYRRYGQRLFAANRSFAASIGNLHHASMTPSHRALQDSRIVMGTMTGTSIDGDLDVAAIAITGRGNALRTKFLGGHSHALGALANQLRRAAQQEPMTAMEFTKLAHDFGQAHSHAIDALRTSLGCTPDLIVLHGQTVFHAPPYSWQLLNPWPVACVHQCRVRFDLRAANLASGGEGAPITPLADAYLFGSETDAIGVLNLGGFANATLVAALRECKGAHRAQSVRGFDVCACNHLLDRVARERLGCAFDENGAHAAHGVCEPNALEAVLQVLRPKLHGGNTHRRSLGTGDESMHAIDATKHLSTEDACRTIVEAIAHTIVSVLRDAGLRDDSALLLAGGSARHVALVHAIAGQRTGKTMSTLESHGIPVGMREAAAIAVLGALADDGVSYCVEHVVHAQSRVVESACIAPHVR